MAARAARRAWYHPEAIMLSLLLRPRVFGGVLAGVAAAMLFPQEWPRTVRAALSWDVGGVVYLAFAFYLIATATQEDMRAKARRRDDGRIVILCVIILAIGASFAAIAGLIGQAKAPTVDGQEKTLLAALAIFTLMISWTVTQVAFALHYAHAYYSPNDGSDAEHGFIFPGCESPDFLDFLYFSTSIGATSQTSDTSIRSHALRRLVMLHAVVAFFFNTAVLALTVNIAASLAG
jgi:uncharacterized membrane protein